MPTSDEQIESVRILRFRQDEELVMQLAGLAVLDGVSIEDVINNAFICAIELRRTDPHLPDQIAAAEARLQQFNS